MKPKAIVLCSSGLDSSVNLFEANKKYNVVQVLTFDYGQKAALKEIENSKKLCELLNLSHKVVNLKWFSEFTQTSLINTDANIPTGNDVDIQSLERSNETAEKVWVPNRNGIFLNIAAGFAEGLNADSVVVGFNLEEAQTFPDNSKEYMEALNQSFSFSTQNSVTVKSFTTDLYKKDIYKRAKEIDIPIDLMWPCYFDGVEICKQCESCLRFLRAQREYQ